ncbi:MAG: hypothetical protein WDN04_07635 [Rhodospirillales bacterium]
MRLVAAFLLIAAPAFAQAPPATETGARPGNEIGTGMSLPRSDKAGNINSATTSSELAPNLPAPRRIVSPGCWPRRAPRWCEPHRCRAGSAGARRDPCAGSVNPGRHGTRAGPGGRGGCGRPGTGRARGW